MSQQIKSIVSKILKTFIPLIFGILIFWLLFRQLNFSEIMNILKSEVNFGIIALSLPFGLFANTIRGYRWNLLIKPLGYKPKKSNLVYAVWGNYAVNLGIPRLGEIWRCTIITRYEKIPFSKLLGTLLIDRLSDTIAVGTIVVVAFIMNISYFKAFFVEHPEYLNTVSNIVTSVWTYTAIILILVMIWAIFKFFKHTSIVKKAKEMLVNIWEGVRTITHMKERGLFLFYTLLIWLGYFLYFYICFFAFDFTKGLGWQNGVIAFGMSSLAVAIPAQVGPWHAAVIATLMGFGISQTNAAAFALCVHTIQQLIFTGLVGLVGIFALSITNKGK